MLVGELVSMGVSDANEDSESGCGWLDDAELSLDSAPLPLTVSPARNVHLTIETLKLSCKRLPRDYHEVSGTKRRNMF